MREPDKRRFFPALRCKMGERIYYSTFMTLRDVSEWIQPNEEIHNSKKLSQWIQRQLQDEHAESIARYLTNNSERFFSAIVVGVYEGEPSWVSLSIGEHIGSRITIDESSSTQLEKSLGLLSLRGDERLFAIDGQHRVAGIKRALETNPELGDDEVSAIFVGHSNSQIEKTRRLFTVLNKKAKRIGESNRVAIDEDDGAAIIARRFIDENPIPDFDCEKFVAFNPTAAIHASDSRSITSIVALYQVLLDLYPCGIPDGEIPAKIDFRDSRPEDNHIDLVFQSYVHFWSILIKNVPELAAVLADNGIDAGKYRAPDSSHLLFRPIGQRAFASTVNLLTERGATFTDAVLRLLAQDLWIHKPAWHHIAWNPQEEKIMSGKQLIEAQLLAQIGEPARSEKAGERLQQVKSGG